MSLFVSYHGNQLSNLKIDLIFEISVLTLCWAVTLREILQEDMILNFRPVTYLKLRQKIERQYGPSTLVSDC